MFYLSLTSQRIIVFSLEYIVRYCFYYCKKKIINRNSPDNSFKQKISMATLQAITKQQQFLRVAK